MSTEAEGTAVAASRRRVATEDIAVQTNPDMCVLKPHSYPIPDLFVKHILQRPLPYTILPHPFFSSLT